MPEDTEITTRADWLRYEEAKAQVLRSFQGRDFGPQEYEQKIKQITEDLGV